jgi:hypothetical protein
VSAAARLDGDREPVSRGRSSPLPGAVKSPDLTGSFRAAPRFAFLLGAEPVFTTGGNTRARILQPPFPILIERTVSPPISAVILERSGLKAGACPQQAATRLKIALQ